MNAAQRICLGARSVVKMKPSARSPVRGYLLRLFTGLLVIAAVSLLWLGPVLGPSNTVTAQGAATIFFQPSPQTVSGRLIP